MSLTTWDLKEASFNEEFTNVEDLTLANKGIVDLGPIKQVPNVRSLNLAFNNLATIQGLSVLTALQALNVSHNQIPSLKALAGLPSLASLNAAHNKLSSLSSLSGCTQLTDLWLQNNQIKGPEELRTLSLLSGLQRLCLANNPLSKALEATALRCACLHLCPGITLLDGTPVTAAEKQAAASFDFEGLLASLKPPTPPNVPSAAAASTSGPFSSSSKGRSSPSRQPGAAARSNSQRGSMPVRLNRASSSPNNANGLPGSAGSAGGRSRHGSNLSRGTAASEGDVGQGVDGAAASSSLGGPDAGDIQVDYLTMLATNSGGKRGTATNSRRRMGLAPKPATNLEGSSFQAVLDALPKFDNKLPTTYGPGTGKAKTKVIGPPPGSQDLVFSLKYPKGSQGRAVSVRADGSAAAMWPNGDMLVNVDSDYSNDCLPGPTYRMFAAYKSGSVAVSWDANGGFVQYPSGSIMLMYSKSTGSGTYYSPKGDVLQRWGSASSSEAPPPSIDVQLDAFLGVRFVTGPRLLLLYAHCDGLAYALACGRNLTDALLCWSTADPENTDPSNALMASAISPPPASYGSCGGAGNGDEAAEGAAAAAAPAHGQEPLPELPPPTFLHALGREQRHGHGHSPGATQASSLRGSMAASGKADLLARGGATSSGGFASTQAAALAAPDTRNVDERMADISAITASLSQLTEGLAQRKLDLVRDGGGYGRYNTGSPSSGSPSSPTKRSTGAKAGRRAGLGASVDTSGGGCADPDSGSTAAEAVHGLDGDTDALTPAAVASISGSRAGEEEEGAAGALGMLSTRPSAASSGAAPGSRQGRRSNMGAVASSTAAATLSGSQGGAVAGDVAVYADVSDLAQAPPTAHKPLPRRGSASSEHRPDSTPPPQAPPDAAEDEPGAAL